MKKSKATVVLLSFLMAFLAGWSVPGNEAQGQNDSPNTAVMPCEEDCIASIYNGVLHCKPGGEWKCSYGDR